HHGPHPTIAVGGPAVRDGTDLLDHDLVVEPAIEARRADAGGVIRRRPRHPQRATDRGHRMLGHRPDPLRNHGLFFTTSCAACRISISICFLPSSRSSSRIRWWASRSALNGTTSSLVATAAVAPASKRRFHCRTTLGWMSSSRETSASVFSPFRSCWTTPRLNSTVKTPRRSDFRGNSPMRRPVLPPQDSPMSSSIGEQIITKAVAPDRRTLLARIQRLFADLPFRDLDEGHDARFQKFFDENRQLSVRDRSDEMGGDELGATRCMADARMLCAARYA